MNAVVVVTFSVSNWLITKMIVQILDWSKHTPNVDFAELEVS